MAGYCPGTALAAAAEGKPDTWATVLGGLLGGLLFAFLAPELEWLLVGSRQYGPVTLQGSLGLPGIVVAAPLSGFCWWLAARLPTEGVQ